MKTAYDSEIQTAANKYDIPPEILWGQIQHESDFNPTARNDNKSNGKVVSTDRGLAQINNVAYPNISDAQADNPTFAIDFMAQIDKRNYDEYKDWNKALIAYNAGHYGTDTEYDITYANAVMQCAKNAPYTTSKPLAPVVSIVPPKVQKQNRLQEIQTLISELQKEMTELANDIAEIEKAEQETAATNNNYEYVTVTQNPPHNTLWGIAADLLKNGNLWPDLIRINPGINPATLKVGQKVRWK